MIELSYITNNRYNVPETEDMHTIELSTNPADYPIMRVADTVTSEREVDELLEQIDSELSSNK